MSYEFYKILHLASIFCFLCLASAAFFQAKKPKMLAAGIGIVGFLILVAGMGLWARISGGMHSFPSWVIAKIIIWFAILGGAHSIAKRVQNPARIGIAFLVVCSLAAAILAVLKPWH